MLLVLAATALVALALLSDLLIPRADDAWRRLRARHERPDGRLIGWRRSRDHQPPFEYDPGRERRAEQRARALLRSCVNEEEWAMYRDLGFIRVWGGQAGGPDAGREGGRDTGGAPYAYLVYPHRPILAYLAQTHRLLAEYCVEFLDHSKPYGSARLPDSDDVLAKWMALTGDERRLISTANMHLPGRQLDPAQVTRDLWRLKQWERARMRETAARLG
jgi:hypothetical protein